MNIFNNNVIIEKVNQNIKTLQKILIVLIFISTPNIAQWSTQSPVPTHLDVRGVGAPTINHIFIATEDNMFDDGGALFESTDGGTTWVQRNIPANLSDPFNGLFFFNSQLGWAYGNDNYKTTDGGTTWTQLPFLGSTYFMKFYTTTFGLASGNFDHYVSHDGGDNWVPSPNDIFAFDFINDLTGLGVSDSGIYRTIDGGNTFTLVYSGTAKSAAFLSDSVAAGIADGIFIRSTDGGITWNTGSSTEARGNLTAVSENIVLAWGRSGPFPNYDDRVFRSTDGGQSWTDLGEIIPEGVFAFTVINSQNVIASDMNGNMFQSTNGGENWTQTFTSPNLQPSFLSSAVPVFADNQTGYFGYGSGFVIKTTDGGASWFQISSGSGNSLNDIDRFENGNMIAVGDFGTILTSNGVSPWVLHQTITQYDILAVNVIGSDEVAVVDETGKVFKSSDGGVTWDAAGISPPNLDANDLHFTSLMDGWVIGQGSIGNVLFHTTDGGNTWVPASGFGGAYIAVDVEGSNVWAQNVSGRYYYSFDNGSTWTMGELPDDPYQISDLDFYNESIGYAVGWYGYAARSNDGGVTWEVLGTPNSDDNFTDIYLIGPNELWISTNDDVAYYSANGGLNWAVLNIGSAGFGNFSAITANPDGDAWAVGYQGYIEKFDGPPPPPPNRPPEASFEYSNISLTVNFTDTSIDPDGIIVSWHWDFGDGTGSTDQNPTHIYDSSGIYLVRLTVTDDDGDSSTAGRSIPIQQIGGTFGNFTEVTPLDSLFVTPNGEDFWVMTTAPGDYDTDGDLDIAVLGYYVVYNQSVDYKLVLLRNDGSVSQTEWEFTYVDVPLDNLTAGSSDIAWGDMDGDTDLDLVVGSDGKTVIYLNDGGNLVLTDTELPGYYEDNDQADYDINSISCADFDNDGDFDLLIPSAFDDTSFTFRTALMRNDSSNGTGGRVFTEIDSVFAPTSHAQSSWADFDNDQDLDLLLVNLAPLTDEGFIKRYRNDGNGVFVGEDILGGILIVEHGEVQWGDYDGDGDLDILVAGNIRDTTGSYIHMALRIYENVNDNFIPFNVIDNPATHGWYDLTAATWADYDSDGDIDILLAGTHNPGTGHIEGRAQIYANDGNGNFTQTENELPAPRSGGAWGGTFSWLDIDDEGDLDYFIAGEYFVPGGNGLVETQMHIYRNDVLELNNAPTSPTGLTVILQPDKSVFLSWIAGSDDNTPAPALTYDIVVVRNGTHTPTKTGEPVPLTLPARLPEPGNISAVTEWVIRGLPDGHYNWMLRTVDAAYVGSPVAVGEFSIGVTSIDDENDNTPNVYSLEQNYPNPFNPTTIIRYSVPKESFVSLKVYNVIGEEVSKLVNEIKDAGSYNIVFDAANFASGVYFYRLQAGTFSQVKKMIITK